MPRITDERREARREQVLEAARACLQEHGLEAVSMEMIIARSGLSTGAVYGYFKGKDDIINAVVSDGTAAMGRQLVPILTDPEPPPLPQFAEQLLRVIADFGRGKPGGIDRLLVSLHGWSHSQSEPGLKAATRTAYRRQRELFAETVRRWQAAGKLDPGADPGGVAELLQSVILGFVAQRALAGDADVQAHARALDALTRPRRPDLPGGRGAALDSSQR
jgi:TetR/AcrR family transcriptional regulator, transcriptional repressor of aconitase